MFVGETMVTPEADPKPDPKAMIRSAGDDAAQASGRAEADNERDALLARAETLHSQVQASTRARDRFLAIVSHELRSPLNAIQSWAYVLARQLEDASPAIQRALAGIRSGVEQQARLIEDLLDASRIMSGKLPLRRQPVALRPTVQAAVERL